MPYSFTDDWNSCDSKSGLSYVYCKARSVGQAPTNYIAYGLWDTTKSAVHEVSGVAGDAVHEVVGNAVGGLWDEIKVPVLIGAGIFILYIVIK